MSSDSDHETGPDAFTSSTAPGDDEFNVEDAEGFVDKQLKKRVLDKRRDIDEVGEEAFVAAQLGEIEYETALTIWHDRIRSWLQSIEPLLRSTSLPRAEEVYTAKALGTVTIEPPAELRRATGRPQTPAEADGMRVLGEVQPRKITISGLKEIIERERLGTTWEVTVQSDEPGAPPKQTVRRTVTQPIPRNILRDAVRTADCWLQEAGVGFEISTGTPHGKT